VHIIQSRSNNSQHLLTKLVALEVFHALISPLKELA
jgi:hypothetical protein